MPSLGRCAYRTCSALRAPSSTSRRGRGERPFKRAGCDSSSAATDPRTNLPLTNVTVVDQTGKLLSAKDAGDDSALDPRQLKYTKQIEQSIVKRIETILEPFVGGENVRAMDMLAMHHGPELFIGNMVLDGVFERHRALRGASVELGAGWVPALLERLDWTVDIWKRTDESLAGFERRPSEQLAEQFGFTPYVYEPVGALIDQTSAELYLFSSDYPHVEGSENAVAVCDRQLVGFDAEARRVFFGGVGEMIGL